MGTRSNIVTLLVAACSVSCGGTPFEPPKSENEARQLSPIPACATVLETAGPPGMRVSLRDEYWKLVFPAFEEEHGRLPPDALACTGDAVLKHNAFRHATIAPKVTSEQLTLGGGADGIKPVWLRSHTIAENEAAGAIALVRVQDEFAYVVAVGSHRGRPDARISLDRLGDEVLLIVRDEGCRGNTGKGVCSSFMTVYLVRQGRLLEGTKLALERVATGDGEALGERGMTFHLTSAPSFTKDELRLVEHVSVKDSFGREVRWAELERVFIVMGNVFQPSDVPLWSRVVGPRSVSR